MAGLVRQLVDAVHSTGQGSTRRACRALRAERSSYHYRARCPDQAELKRRIKEIAETRVRYGHRRIHVLLRREGWAVNGKRVYRLYKEMGLQLRKKAQASGQGQAAGRSLCGDLHQRGLGDGLRP